MLPGVEALTPCEFRQPAGDLDLQHRSGNRRCLGRTTALRPSQPQPSRLTRIPTGFISVIFSARRFRVAIHLPSQFESILFMFGALWPARGAAASRECWRTV
jgi:hypothetical protein